MKQKDLFNAIVTKLYLLKATKEKCVFNQVELVKEELTKVIWWWS